MKFFFLVVLITLALFYGDRGVNQNARIAAIFSFVEPGHPDTGTFRIDRFAGPKNSRPFSVKDAYRGIFTSDWSQHDGHYYANKAPGTILLGVPLYFLLYRAEWALGLDPISSRLTELNIYLLNLFLCVFPTALAATALLWLLRNKGWNARDSALVAAAYAFATLVFPFSTSLWGHASASAFLLLAIVCLQGKWPLAWAGFLFGLAVATEYTSALGLLPMTLLIRRREKGWQPFFRFALGGVAPAAALLGYQWHSFGNPFVTAFDNTNPIYMEGDSSAWSVFSAPSLLTMAKLLVFPGRGLLVYCPIFLTCALSWQQMKSRADKLLALAYLAPAVALWLLISGFNGWHGGWSSGPRYLIPAIPFLCLLLPRVSKLRGVSRGLFFLAFAFSLVNMWAVSLVDVMAPSIFSSPLHEKIYPQLFGLQPLERGGFLFFAEQPSLQKLMSLAVLLIALGLIWAWAKRQDGKAIL
jgi:hypothetical protein